MSTHTHQTDTSTDTSDTRNQKPPSVSTTGLGYDYVRCQRGETDETVYIHQLCAILDGADPHDVFSDRYDVHHLPLSNCFDLEENCSAPPIPDLGIPAIDTPESVEIQARWEHRQGNLSGVADD